MRPGASALVVVFSLLALAIPRAHADDASAAPETSPAPTIPTSAPDDSHWRWRELDQVEGVVTLLALATGVAVVMLEPDVGVLWTDRWPLDDDFRGGLALRSADDRLLAAKLGDAGLLVFLGWPILVDGLLLAGAVHGDWDAALQMMLIDAEVLAIAFAITALTTRFMGRERPNDSGCSAIPPGEPGACPAGIGHHTSFASGHALMSVASAGLICTHHLENPWLTGSREGAAIACGSGLLLATAVGVSRVMADLHWASDVALGSAIGALLGFALPHALHYIHPTRRRGESRSHGPAFVVVPRVDASERGLGVIGVF